MNATPGAPLSPLLAAAADAAGIGDVAHKVARRERLDLLDGQRLFAAPPAVVGALANTVRERLHGDHAWFNRNQHINATNVCEATCMFCSFSRLKTGDAAAYTMTLDAAVSRLKALRGELVTEIHIVNGLNPDLPFSYYTDLLRALKAERPDLHIKGFTAVEIHYYAEKYGMTYEGVLVALREAGLDSLPGGGAEIFHPRVRQKICADKVDADGWLEVHRVAHGLGMRSNCTMLFGMIETVDERLDHLLRLRALQDETGGFQTFIPLKFHNEHNRLAGLFEATAVEVLQTYAVSRLMLDNIPHLKAYWPMLGVQVAQASLAWGVDDLDGTVREERIYHMAGAKTPQALSRADLIALIRDAGRVPVERDTLYHTVAEVSA
jgi:aminodeoxyfutalosine synthase